MRAKPFRFPAPRYRSPLLALTDGGVYDNMADEWLLKFSERAQEIEKQAEEVGKRLGGRAPTFLLVANASGSLDPRFAWMTFVPFVGELSALMRTKSVLYENGNSTRRRMIFQMFGTRSLTGIIVNIKTDPWQIVGDGIRSKDPAVQARARDAAERLALTPGLTEKETTQPAGAATVLYPLARGKIAALLQRSYALTGVNLYIWHDVPLVQIPPLTWFEGIEAGRVGERSLPLAASRGSSIYPR
jgi:hypothetical protein